MHNPAETFFDANHYIIQNPGQYFPEGPLQHYFDVGCREGASPSPYFDVTWYSLNNSDLEEFGGNVLEHYVTVGRDRRAMPHPGFHSQWYWENYLADSDPESDPLEHYITTGWRQGNRPNPLFWSDYYAKTYLGQSEGQLDPFLHFILGGWRSCNPNPLFDTEFYTLTQSADPDPLSHYMHVGWRHGASPHPLFDPGHFLQDAGLSLETLDCSPLQLLLENKCQADPHPLFSARHYRSQLATIGIVLPKDQHALLTYVERGYRDTCAPHPFFSKSHYYQHSPDVYSHGTDALQHFLLSGHAENRSFHPLFQNDHYRAAAQLGESTNLLLHYLNQDAQTQMDCRRAEIPDQITHPLPGARRILDVPTDKVTFDPDPTENPEGKIGAFLHIFYPELAAEMLAAVNNIPGDCTVFISTDSTVKMHAIRSTCREVLTHPYEIRVVPNRGRDIAPMLVGFADRMRQVDYGVHIHSKRSKHYASEFEDWRRYLIDGNLGSPELVRNILGLLKRDEIGAVMPEHFYPIRSLIQWGGNFENISGLLSLLGEEIHRETTLDFPSGSMFWFKTKALQPLLNLHLSIDHFDHENGQVDGTLAHALERSFFYFASVAGYEYAVINPTSDSTPRRAKHPVSSQKFLGNRFFITERDKGPLRQHYPETTRFLARPSDTERPRINLLIPTVDTGKAYAGVATALDMYFAIREELGDAFDARMIASDMSPGNQYCPPDGYEMRSLTAADEAGLDCVVDAARRFHSPLSVRKNDIFLATAWWTAMNGFDLGRQQAAMFGQPAHPLAYMIQDDECGFYAWSTKYALADATYRKPDITIPIFNTELLYNDFRERGYYDRGHVLQPGINQKFSAAISHGTPKEKLVLLYARPHAERNCLPFLDSLVSQAVASDPVLWDGWQFLAIGEDFDQSMLASDRIRVLGRLTIDEYAQLASRAAMAVSLMVSPHPSYPPLEMAEAGAKVLTNTHSKKDLSELHGNIQSFRDFSISGVARQLSGMARDWATDPQGGWSGKPKVDWFFGGGSNMDSVAKTVAQEIRTLV